MTAPDGEFALIRRHFARPAMPLPATVALGIGDDCALLRPPAAGEVLAVSTDLLIEGQHFFAGTDPAAIGHKALAVNLSDLAAMGAVPLGFTLGLALPEVDDGWLAAFRTGLFALADRWRCPLVGGDTTRGPLALALTVFGTVAEAGALRRDGARPGDRIWVTGPLGGAAWAVAARRRDDDRIAAVDATAAAGAAGPAGAADTAGSAGSADAAAVADAIRRLDWPQPRLAEGRALVGIARAAIDLSDGLAGDLGHVLAASAAACVEPLGARLDEAALPLAPAVAALAATEARRFALHGGDDYELLFTAPPEADAAVRAAVPAATAIGRITSGRGDADRGAGRGEIRLDGRDGRPLTVAAGGFDHFRAPAAQEQADGR